MSKLLKYTRRTLNNRVLPWVLRNRFDPKTINVSASNNVALYPRLRLAFNRIKKNGNSTSVSLLYDMEQGEFISDLHAKRNSIYLHRARISTLARIDEYFLFVIIRNPYSRVLSAFLNKFRKPEYIQRYRAFDLTPRGFQQFLIWLGETGLILDAHWNLQKNLVLGPLHGFDAILRFEEFPGCLSNLLKARKLALPDNIDHILASVNSRTRTGADRKAASFYSREVVEIVQVLYDVDFSFLGYSKDFPYPQDTQ